MSAFKNFKKILKLHEVKTYYFSRIDQSSSGGLRLFGTGDQNKSAQKLAFSLVSNNKFSKGLKFLVHAGAQYNSRTYNSIFNRLSNLTLNNAHTI